MLDILVTCLAICAFFFALLSFCVSAYLIIEKRAMSLSTHKVEYVPMTYPEIKAEAEDTMISADVDKFNRARIDAMQDSDFQDII